MVLTNRANLPEALVRAVANDPYVGGGDISVTQLIGPPQIRQLRRQHEQEITEDVADRIWSLLGQTVHVILERADLEPLKETRLSMIVNDWEVSGQFDRLVYTPEGVLQDYKVTSSWTHIHGAKPEWEAQLNCLAALCRTHHYPVERVEVVAIYRDWSRRQAQRNADYPQVPAQIVPIRLWDQDACMHYMEARVALHQRAELGVSIPCTDEERWYRGSQYAVMKRARKSALALFNNEQDAQSYMSKHKDVVQLSIEHRPGTYARCEEYCPVANFCPQWNRGGHTDGADDR